MSRTRIVKGKITEIVGGEYNIYSKENIVLTSLEGSVTANAGKGITHGKPRSAPLAPKHFFVKGWWSSDQAGTKEITEALVDDIVYFHVETKNIPDGEVVQMKLYDDDNTEIKEPTEKNENDKDDFIVTTSGNKAGITDKKVNGNKIVIALRLSNLEKFITNEADKELELYYRSSYKNEHVELPRTPSDYLKVTVDTIPQLILVNGHWNKVANALGASPGAGGEKYWNYFLGNSKNFIASAETNFNINYKQGTPYYFDGSSFCGSSSSGSERKAKGKAAAKEKFENELKKMQTKKYYFISHSEGGAFAAGVAEYLAENGVKVGEHIMLSCDEADEFSVTSDVPTYQLTPCYITKDYTIVKKIANIPRFILHSQPIKKIRDCYVIVDWVVGDYQLKGATKYGVIIDKSSSVDWMSLHAALIDSKIFRQLDDLKKVRTGQIIGEHHGEFYSGYAQYDASTLFYKIDDKIIIDNVK